jgi:hypothetical protein
MRRKPFSSWIRFSGTCRWRRRGSHRTWRWASTSGLCAWSTVNPRVSSEEGTTVFSGLFLGRRFLWELLIGLFYRRCYIASVFTGVHPMTGRPWTRPMRRLYGQVGARPCRVGGWAACPQLTLTPQFRSSSTLASKGTSLAPLKSTGIHVQDMLCLLAASSAYAHVIALIPSGIA